MGQDWAPTSDEEKSLKDAITALQTSIVSVAKTGDQADAGSRFVLNSKDFYDVRAYIMSGKELPSADYEFDSRFGGNSFGDIVNFDNEIYSLTRKTMVEVGTTCQEYYNNQLSRLINALSPAIQYAENTTENLYRAEQINLKHQFGILLQDKYKSRADQDGEFNEAREAGLMTCEMVKEDASNKKREIDDIRATLISLKSKTQAFQPDVQKVIKQFKAGPAENSSNDQAAKRPYLDRLDAKYNTKLSETKKQLEGVRIKSSDLNTKPGMAVGLAQWPGLGWIPLDIARTDSLKSAYNELEGVINEGERENNERTRLATNVSMLIEQSSDIDGKLSNLITALGKLSDFFGTQVTCVQKIDSYLNRVSGNPDSASNRRDFVLNGLTKTADLLQELKKTAEEFQRNATGEVQMRRW
ncbi:hypothetical protein LTR84_004442 [Exophiala bonariae]|uniref:Fungal N-terminal domain-containing protein n=1 Tax=Exophiala bonariae TaxID=1690606 RepID=A0AAV9N534_9EURO|nr:hypothetical protein LTR84_004442 [Exophiala bonariae]